MDNVIEVCNLVKVYDNHRGIFDLSFTVKKGEMLGYVGTNGSGKSTTIRHLMGFSKPDVGKCLINGIDTWKYPELVMENIGYVPSSLTFPDLGSASELIRDRALFLKNVNMDRVNNLIKTLELDVRLNPKVMSKGERQKLAIILALMGEPDILILDEATTGLDPIMMEKAMKIIDEYHKTGKTILFSSNRFDEIEDYCDRVGLIIDGRLVNIIKVSDIKNSDFTFYKIGFNKNSDFKKFLDKDYIIDRRQDEYNQVVVKVEDSKVFKLLKDLSNYDLKFISEVKYDLERYFRDFLLKMEV